MWHNKISDRPGRVWLVPRVFPEEGHRRLSAGGAILALSQGLNLCALSARAPSNPRDVTICDYLYLMYANPRIGHLARFSGRGRIEFDNPRWIDRWLTCCLIYWVSEVGSDLTKFVPRVASPDAMRRERPNRYGRVSRHISHEFEISENIFRCG